MRNARLVAVGLFVLIALGCTSAAKDAGLTIIPCEGGCPADQTCFQNACVGDCVVAGGLVCGTACVDPASDDQNCGGCGQTCPGGQFCYNGACIIACPTGLTACANALGTTYCVDLQGDLRNCGRCGASCSAGQYCIDGGCASAGVICPANQTICAVDGGGVICADLNTDPSSCGSCFLACTQWEQCIGGKCVGPTSCPTGLQLCTLSSGSATCADLQTDVDNCGHCGNSCGLRAACTGGACSCQTGFTTCSSQSSLVCADLSSDVANCGACGQSCVACEKCLVGACQAETFLAAGTPVAFPMVDSGFAWPRGVAVGDFNADGKLDLAVINGIGESALQLAFGDGTGGFPTSSTYFLAYPTFNIAVGDLKGDGSTEIVVSILGTQGGFIGSGFLVLTPLADGGLATTGPFESDPTETPNPGLGSFNVGLAVADFNSDGLADVAIANPSQGVDVFYALQDGGFDKVSPVFAGAWSDWMPQMSVGDLNGDGRTDLAVLTDAAFAVLLQTPDGGLGTAVQLTSFSGLGIIAGQLLVEANFDSYSLSTYRLDSTGALTFLANYSVPTLPGVYGVWSGLAVDLNQDGFPDVVTTGYGESAIWLSHGPDGGLDQGVTFDIGGEYVGQLASGDFNGDGRPDIAAAGAGLAPVTAILLNECVP
jgi:hypothetical protein